MISFGDNSFIKYTYSATGEKLGVEYGVRLQPVLSPTDEGYVTFTATGTPQYHYYLRVHLGNIRVVMGQTCLRYRGWPWI